MSDNTTAGLDLAKNVLQVHGGDGAGRAVTAPKLQVGPAGASPAYSTSWPSL